MVRILAIIAMTLALAASSSVSAQITETITFRSNSVSACGQIIPPAACNEPADEEFLGPGDFVNLHTANESTIGTASALAEQDSSIVTGFYSGVLSAVSSADGSAGAISNASARSEFSVTIELTEATTFDVTASGVVNDGPDFTSVLAELVIVETPLGAPLIPVQVSDGPFNVTETITIGPGTFLITVQAFANCQGQFASTSGDAMIDFSVNLPGGGPDDEFIRGDADGGGDVNGLVDGLFILDFAFTQGPVPPCMDTADVDDSGDVNGLVDGLALLTHFFAGGPQPASPYPDCGTDPGPVSLGCETPPCP